jgi:hypothetical protein
MSATEAKTRSEKIDVLLLQAGWNTKDLTQVIEEFDIITRLPDGISQPRTPYEGHQFSDYVLLGKDGRPIAVVEAKKTSKDAFEQKAHALYVHGLFWFFQKILEKNAPAAAQKNINLAILRGLEVPKPPIELQIHFAVIVEKVEGIKSYYQQSLTDLDALYGTLSQQAFKGEVDISRLPLNTEPMQ